MCGDRRGRHLDGSEQRPARRGFRGVDVAFGGGAYTASFLALNQAGASYVVRAARISTAGAIAAGPVTGHRRHRGVRLSTTVEPRLRRHELSRRLPQAARFQLGYCGDDHRPGVDPLRYTDHLHRLPSGRSSQPSPSTARTTWSLGRHRRWGPTPRESRGRAVDSAGTAPRILQVSAIAEGISLGSRPGSRARIERHRLGGGLVEGDASAYPFMRVGSWRTGRCRTSGPADHAPNGGNAVWRSPRMAPTTSSSRAARIYAGLDFLRRGRTSGRRPSPRAEGGRPAVAFNGTNYLVAWAEDSTFMRARPRRARLVRCSAPPRDRGRRSAAGPPLPRAESVGSWLGTLLAALTRSALPGSPRPAMHRMVPLIAEGAGAKVVSRPSAAWDGTQYLVAWYDERAQAAYFGDIYGARVLSDGTLRDPTGFPIAAEPESEAFPALRGRSEAGKCWSPTSALIEGALWLGPHSRPLRERSAPLRRRLYPRDAMRERALRAGRVLRRRCTGACESCLGARTSEEDGTCAPVSGQDRIPRVFARTRARRAVARRVSAAPPALRALYPASTPCGSPVCDGALLKDQSCDGSGACVPRSRRR